MSLKPEPRRSARLAASGKAQTDSTPILTPVFPTEIILEILSHLLTSPEKLAFCPIQLSSKEEAANPRNRQHQRSKPWYSKTLRLARLNHCAFREPVAKALIDNFNAVCLVSKDTRLMARGLFFSKNEWVLHCNTEMDAIPWVMEKWGKEAFVRMTDVRIQLQGTYSLMVTMYKAVAIFVAACMDNGSRDEKARLCTLSVQWIGPSRALSCARVGGRSWHVHPCCRDHGLERNALRQRGLIIPEGQEDEYDDDDRGTPYRSQANEPLDWKEEEVVLLPLSKMRGIINARIEGTVREKWAVWLEQCMTARVGEEVEAFEFDDIGKEAIQKLITDAN